MRFDVRKYACKPFVFVFGIILLLVTLLIIVSVSLVVGFQNILEILNTLR